MRTRICSTDSNSCLSVFTLATIHFRHTNFTDLTITPTLNLALASSSRASHKFNLRLYCVLPKMLQLSSNFTFPLHEALTFKTYPESFAFNRFLFPSSTSSFFPAHCTKRCDHQSLSLYRYYIHTYTYIYTLSFGFIILTFPCLS